MEKVDIQFCITYCEKEYLNAKGILEVVDNSQLFLLILNFLFLLLKKHRELIESLRALELNRPQSKPWV